MRLKRRVLVRSHSAVMMMMSCAVVQGEEGVVADPAAPAGHCGGPVATCGEP